MIETCSAYKVGEKTFPTLKEAQIAALNAVVFQDGFMTPKNGGEENMGQAVIESVVSNKDAALAILSMSEPKERTRKPRSDRGKKHKAASAAEPELPGVKVEGSGKYKNQ